VDDFYAARTATLAALPWSNIAPPFIVINAGFAVGLGEKGLKTRHLRIRQPEKIRHCHRSFSSRESCHQAEINGS